MNVSQWKKARKLYDDEAVIRERLSTILDSLRSKYERMSEKAKDSDKGNARESAISSLEDAINNLDASMEAIDCAYGSFNDEFDDYL